MRLPDFTLRCGFALAGLAAPTLSAAEGHARAPLEIAGRPVLGRDTAPIRVTEISSFKCGHCWEFHQKVFPRLRAAYVDTGRVQWVMLNASDDPADQHAQIFAIAQGVARQGKYWELLDDLFRVASRPPSFLTDLVAKSPLIDREQLELSLRDRSVRNAVASDFADYARLKSRGTPTFLVTKTAPDGRRTETVIAGLKSPEHFEAVFDEMLKSP